MFFHFPTDSLNGQENRIWGEGEGESTHREEGEEEGRGRAPFYIGPPAHKETALRESARERESDPPHCNAIAMHFPILSSEKRKTPLAPHEPPFFVLRHHRNVLLVFSPHSEERSLKREDRGVRGRAMNKMIMMIDQRTDEEETENGR